MKRHGIPQGYFGLRSWGKFLEPIPFNIVVNDMSEVMKHKDVQHGKAMSGYGVQSSCAGGYHVSLPAMPR